MLITRKLLKHETWGNKTVGFVSYPSSLRVFILSNIVYLLVRHHDERQLFLIGSRWWQSLLSLTTRSAKVALQFRRSMTPRCIVMWARTPRLLLTHRYFQSSAIRKGYSEVVASKMIGASPWFEMLFCR